MVGMFGCLPSDRIIDAPSAFQRPISWQGPPGSRSLHMVSADVGLQGGSLTGLSCLTVQLRRRRTAVRDRHWLPEK